jgi:hypothetical protein
LCAPDANQLSLVPNSYTPILLYSYTPILLYSYKEDELYTFSDYRLIEDLSEVQGQTFAFVFDTLGGDTARSEGGVATIRAVGDFLNEKQNSDCFAIYAAIGLDIGEHYARTMRIAPSRLFAGLSMLVHQPTNRISLPKGTKKAANADLLFAYLEPKTGFAVFNTQPQLTKKLESVYNANGKLNVQAIPAFVAPWFMLLNMLHFVTWNVDNWTPFERFRANHELWPLMIRARTEILTLPRFG